MMDRYFLDHPSYTMCITCVFSLPVFILRLGADNVKLALGLLLRRLETRAHR